MFEPVTNMVGTKATALFALAIGMMVVGAVGNVTLFPRQEDFKDEDGSWVDMPDEFPPADVRTSTPSMTKEAYDQLSLWEKYNYNEKHYLDPHWKWFADRFPEDYTIFIATGALPARPVYGDSLPIITPEKVGAWGTIRAYGYGSSWSKEMFYSFFNFRAKYDYWT